MSGPARLLVAEVQRQPATLAELAERLQYPVHRVLGFITEARTGGVPILVRMVPGEPSLVVVRGDERDPGVPATLALRNC
ncbi:MAG TPA: hypothetical protein VFI40_04820 [Nocardioides sp.]|nr:hypothetical protein [Nocardioides sp.]